MSLTNHRVSLLMNGGTDSLTKKANADHVAGSRSNIRRLLAEIGNVEPFTPAYLNPLVPDCLSWKNQLDGTYSAQSGYSWLLNRILPLSSNCSDWNWIWKAPGPEKIKVFMWLACHNSLPMAKVLHHRNMLDAPTCPRCHNTPETVLHALRDCPHSQNLWRALGFTDVNFYANSSVGEWLRHGVNSHTFASFVAGIWWLAQIISVSVCLSRDHQPVRSTSWHFTKEDVTVLNVDGSSIGNPGRSGIRGLLRRSDGDWIIGFAGNLGFSEILKTELMAIYKGLLLAWDLGFRRLNCYSDSKVAVELIEKKSNPFHAYAVIIQTIKDLLLKDWSG